MFVNKYYYNFYVKHLTWVSFDLLLLLQWFNYELKNFVNFSKLIVTNRFGFLSFFFNGFFDFKFFFFNLIDCATRVKFSQYINLIPYISILYTSLYLNPYLMLYSYSLFNINFFNFFASNIYLNRFLSYSLQHLNYNFFLNYNSLNKRMLRNITPGRFGSLIGFKLQCLGRFSRKQRASSIWFREMRIPLNTLNAIIDFGFFSVPIRNSIATIKIWLYRDINYTRFYFKLL